MARRLYAYGMVDDRRARAKLLRAQKKITQQAWTSTRDLVSFGANYAKQIVPFKTGQTYRAIRTQTKPQPDGSRGSIYIQLKNRNDGGDRTRTLTTQDLVSIMHTWSGAQNHFKSGNPKFMEATREALKSTGKRMVKGSFLKLNFN